MMRFLYGVSVLHEGNAPFNLNEAVAGAGEVVGFFRQFRPEDGRREDGKNAGTASAGQTL
jgi:hypothetical protein